MASDALESRSIDQRHHIVQLGMWLILDPGARLAAAWRARAVRYNALLKDFADPPEWYAQAVGDFSNWRDRIN